jgi:soluble cytochrome b562
MLYFEMLVSNNNLLNILLPNDNKVLKEALKEADSKTLELLVKNNTGSVGDVLKDLFENLKTGTKSNTNIESILKNSTVFKEMGNFQNSLSSMLESLTSEEKNPTLEKFKPILENFLKNIKDMDTNTLKTQLQNSGVFLESKMTQTPNAKIENILNQVQNLIKDLNTPQAKQVNELISKLIQSPNSNDFTSNLKTLTNSLEKLNNSIQTPQTQNISTSLNQLKNILNEATLTESKISNNVVVNTNTKENINLQTKELLTQLKNEIVQNPVLQTNKSIMPILENLLKMGNLFDKNENLTDQLVQNNLSNINSFTSNFSSNVTPLLTSLKDTLENLNPNNLSLQNQVTKFIEKIEDIIKELSNPATHKNQTQNLDEDMKSILLKMQDELSSKTDTKSQELTKQVDKLLTQIDYQQLLSLSSNSNSVYVPFLWDMLEDGNISMKKADENKFYCQINLTLKDFGKVDLMLALYDKNKLDLTVYAQREHFKTAIRDNIQQLKIALNSVDLIPVNIKLLDLKDENESKNKPTQTYINNSYNQNINLTSGIDIRA